MIAAGISSATVPALGDAGIKLATGPGLADFAALLIQSSSDRSQIESHCDQNATGFDAGLFLGVTTGRAAWPLRESDQPCAQPATMQNAGQGSTGPMPPPDPAQLQADHAEPATPGEPTHSAPLPGTFACSATVASWQASANPSGSAPLAAAPPAEGRPVPDVPQLLRAAGATIASESPDAEGTPALLHQRREQPCQNQPFVSVTNGEDGVIVSFAHATLFDVPIDTLRKRTSEILSRFDITAVTLVYKGYREKIGRTQLAGGQ